MYFSTFFQKLGFLFFQFSQWNYIETYNYLYLLDSKKSKVYFFIMFCPRKKNLATLGLKTSDKKIWKIIIFKANPRLVKSSYCPKIILNFNIWTFICKKRSKTWPLLVLVSLKYCVEKRLLKTHVAFFMKVTVHTISNIWRTGNVQVLTQSKLFPPRGIYVVLLSKLKII
jgi:hypothetical protein